MTTISAIAKAFVAAQKEFAPALKTATNPHFRSQYVDLAGCVEAVIDALNNHGIALVQKTHECETGIKIETIFLHESGESMSGGVLHVPADKQTPQGYGSALTYARRYSLMSACAIAPEDDDGNAATKSMASKLPAKKSITLEIPGKDPKPMQSDNELADQLNKLLALIEGKEDVDVAKKRELIVQLVKLNINKLIGKHHVDLKYKVDGILKRLG
jgi:hypothetical protein